MVHVIKDGETAVIHPRGDIVASGLERIRSVIQETVADHSGPVAIDLADAVLVDSMGIGLLIATQNTLEQSGRKLILRNAGRDLRNLFRTMRLDKHFLLQ